MKCTVHLIPLISAILSFSLLAQGNLEPPGPPAPTMKTLDQVEARTPVSAGGELSESGSYYLTNNVFEQIAVTADNVTLDLNGFTIDVSDSGYPYGVYLAENSGTQILNGTITGAAHAAVGGSNVSFVWLDNLLMHGDNTCINLPTPSGALTFSRIHCDTSELELVRIFAVDDDKLTVTIRDSTFTNANSRMDEDRSAINLFRVGTGSFQAIITDNRVYSNRYGGILVSSSAGLTAGSVVDNHVFNNGGTGILVSGDFVVARNIAQGNTANYNLAGAPNAAPVQSLADNPAAWSNIGE